MLARTKYTYRKLTKVYTGTAAECRALWEEYSVFPRKDVVTCTRGACRIMYYRPCGGTTVNDKIGMLRWNDDGTVSLYL